MLEGIIICVVVNILLLILISGVDITVFNSQAIFEMFSPYDYNIGKMNMTSFVSNLAFTYVIVILLQKRCDENLKMVHYQIKNRKRISIYINQKKDVYKYILAIILGKVLSDIVFNQIFGTENKFQLAYIEISFASTVALWSEMIYMINMFMNGMLSLFITLLIIMSSILLLPCLEEYSFVAYISGGYKGCNLLLKLMLGIIILCLNIIIFRKKDILY